MAENTFGFKKKDGAGGAREKLALIQPSEKAAEPPVSMAAVDAVAERQGFVSREAKAKLPDRRKKIEGNTVGINMRAPEDVARDFIQFCDEHRLSYWEGIAELMRRDRAR